MDFVKKGKKVTVIGAGNVGASIAFTLAIKGLCSELLLVDINKPKAKGEAMDIMQGTAFCPAVDVRDGDYADAVNSDLVIITVGIARSRVRPELTCARPMQRLWHLLCRKLQSMHRMLATSL